MVEGWRGTLQALKEVIPLLLQAWEEYLRLLLCMSMQLFFWGRGICSFVGCLKSSFEQKGSGAKRPLLAPDS